METLHEQKGQWRHLSWRRSDQKRVRLSFWWSLCSVCSFWTWCIFRQNCTKGSFLKPRKTSSGCLLFHRTMTRLIFSRHCLFNVNFIFVTAAAFMLIFPMFDIGFHCPFFHSKLLYAITICHSIIFYFPLNRIVARLPEFLSSCLNRLFIRIIPVVFPFEFIKLPILRYQSVSIELNALVIVLNCRSNYKPRKDCVGNLFR